MNPSLSEPKGRSALPLVHCWLSPHRGLSCLQKLPDIPQSPRKLKLPSHTALVSEDLILLGARFSAQRTHDEATEKPTPHMMLSPSFFTPTHTGRSSPDISLIGSKKNFLDRLLGTRRSEGYSGTVGRARWRQVHCGLDRRKERQCLTGAWAPRHCCLEVLPRQVLSGSTSLGSGT